MSLPVPPSPRPAAAVASPPTGLQPRWRLRTAVVTVTVAVGGAAMTTVATALAADADPTATVVALGAALTLVAAGLAGLAASARARGQHRLRALTIEADLLAQALRHGGDGILLADPDGRIDWADAGFLRLLGRPPGSITGQPLAAVLADDPHGPQRAAIDGLVTAAIEAGTVTGTAPSRPGPDASAEAGGDADGHRPASRLELRVSRTDGRRIWLSLAARIRRDPRGAVDGVVVVAADIDERKAAEQRMQAVRDDAQRLSRELRVMTGLARDSHNGIVLTDTEGRITWVNPGFERMSGWTLAELAGHKPGALLQCEGTDAAEVARLRAAIHRRERCTAELLNRSRDGRDYWVGLDVQPLTGPDGRHEGFAAFQTDVTERRRMVDDLRGGMALVEAVFEALPLPVVLKGPDGRLQRVNAAAARFAGRAPRTLLGRTTAEVLPGEVGRRHDEEDAHLLREPGTRQYEATVDGPRGTPAHLLVSKRTVLDPQGRAIGLVIALVDLTAQQHAARASREAREAAEAANRAKSSFLAVMSHEIRTPMNGVIGTAELLAHDRRLEPVQAELVGTILASARSLLRLLDDILDFSKIEADRLELESTPFGLAELVEGACRGLAPVAAQRGLDLQVFVQPDLPDVRLGDPTRLRQVLVNLVGNALKFGVRPGDGARPAPVRVAVGPAPAGAVRIDVSDGGIGMDADTVARLFRPFVQGEVSTTRRFGGTGLGLAISRRLVHAMGGTIDVDSRPGVGSTFGVTLPLPPGSGPRCGDAPGRPAAGVDLQGIECRLAPAPGLPVDDLVAWLRHAGARVRSFPTVAAAMAAGGETADAATAAPRPRPVVLLAADDPVADAVTPAPGVRVLRIGRGRRGPARPCGDGELRLDLLRRLPFLEAVAGAAGHLPAPAVRSPVDPDERDDRVAPPSDEQARALGQWILVAEDDPTNRRVISRQLALLGHAAQVVEDGEHAFAAWRAHRHALVLTDLHMPAMDGLDLVRAIRRHEAGRGGPRTPVLALTAHALEGEAARARAAGMDDYLTKPIPVAQLRAALEQWMPAPRARPADAPWPAPSPTPTPTPTPVVDLGVLVALVGDDPDTLAGLVEEFRRTADRQAARLRACRDAGDVRGLAGPAHTLKSAARALGAHGLVAACEAIEAAARARPPAVPPALVTMFDDGLAAVLAALPPTGGDARMTMDTHGDGLTEPAAGRGM